MLKLGNAVPTTSPTDVKLVDVCSIENVGFILHE